MSSSTIEDVHKDKYYQQAVKELSVKNLRKAARKEIKRLGNIKIQRPNK
jgi:hypothetical protein